MSHRWSFCESCMCAMVLCGHCGNNTCNGMSGNDCPDLCASAHEWEKANEAPADLQERERVTRAEWEAMTPEQRDARNQARFDAEFSLVGAP